jgi:hypothetical protein
MFLGHDLLPGDVIATGNLGIGKMAVVIRSILSLRESALSNTLFREGGGST